MARWLLKTEPSEFNFTDLTSKGKTCWSGIRNPTALIHLRSMKKGDLAFIYHTGAEKRIVGTAMIESDAYPDPDASDPRLVVVDISPGDSLKNPVTLSTIKSEPACVTWDLLRITRLSVVPTSDKIWNQVMALSRRSAKV